jgi:hypothetical protein
VNRRSVRVAATQDFLARHGLAWVMHAGRVTAWRCAMENTSLLHEGEDRSSDRIGIAVIPGFEGFYLNAGYFLSI